ncbi:HU family DNA-binding protein [Treponema pedis]|uniref:HU family DNA-binding protein n=1 Tax=Treponema pedis TaxID=409322 RepID=UPI00042A7F8D|nr:HU family DNA-binding protein [Treponema pedis]
MANIKITKRDIVKHIAMDTDVTQFKAEQMLNAFLNFVIENTAKGKIVSINKFGTFKMLTQTRSSRYNFKERNMNNIKFTYRYIIFKNSNKLKNFILNDNIDNM